MPPVTMQGTGQARPAYRLQDRAELSIAEDAGLPRPSPSREEFRARAAMTGLSLTDEDIDALYLGYLGLSALMERIPQRWSWADEPPHVFRADE